MIKQEILDRIQNVLYQDVDTESQDLDLLRHDLELDIIKDENEYDNLVTKGTYYELNVPAGTYSSDNIFSLLWEVFTHRLSHLRKHGKWID
tara:strand:- start:239 stop:511 length:273 start_codon:yes stop_codon:yes gene_type:complete